MRAVPPISITGADFDVPVLGNGIEAAWQPSYVKCDNESPYVLNIAVGPVLHVLPPWTVDVYPVVMGASSLHVHPIALSTPLPPAPTSVLLVTIAGPAESFPGTYPAAMSRTSSIYQLPVSQDYIPADSTTHVKTETLPPGTLSVTALNTSGSGNVTAFKMVGNVTGYDYASATGGAGSFFQTNNVEISYLISAYDTVLTITYASPPGSGTPPNPGLYLTSLTVPTTVDIAPGQLVNATLVGSLGDNVDTGNRASAWRGNSTFYNGLLVERWGTNPAPWEAAGATPVGISEYGNIGFSFSVANGANSVIIAGVANQYIWLHDIDEQNAAVAGSAGIWETTAGTAQHIDDLSVAGFRPWRFSGGATPSQGGGLRFRNTQAPATPFINGHVSYSQT
jgi:hypothetical protein